VIARRLGARAAVEVLTPGMLSRTEFEAARIKDGKR
jgi:hypothetical protein